MKIQYVGDGTAARQIFCYPGGVLPKWATFHSPTVPPWVAQAPAGTFLIDGEPNPGPSQTVNEPEPPQAEPEPKE